jgi:RAMP superfamily.
MAKYQNFYNKNYNNKWNNNNQKNRGYNNQENKDISLDFYNPYSFVPLNNKVYYLNKKEINEINNAHEIPFKESLSGKIEVKFISKTPFCVKGGRNSLDNTNVNDKYFIPATSLKGMIRNVLEIVSMSNIKNSIDDKRYSMRDLRSKDYLLKGNNSTQKSGFLFQFKGNMYIVECNNERKSYSEINNLINKSIYLKDENVKEKYSAVGNNGFIKYNNKDAMWFFSGKMNNKKHEFLFILPNNFNNKYIIEESVFKDFKFIHEKETSSESWKYWKKNLDKNYLSEEEIKKMDIVTLFLVF